MEVVGEVENNNNETPVQAKAVSMKRPATDEYDNGILTIKKQKQNGPESNGTDDIHVPADTTKQVFQCPKTRLQLHSNDKNKTGNNVKYNKKEAFQYGNYKHYYGKRILDKDFHDIRLDVLATQQELFRGKQVLDIGCNSGHLSIEISKKFEVKSLIGLDIDRSLTQDAQLAINHLKRDYKKQATGTALSFPYNVRFVHGNYILEDDVLLEIERPQYDLILCLSVTKWIHLNFCDAGLKQAFRRMFLQLRPGGKLVLEPQSFDTYKRRKKLTVRHAQYIMMDSIYLNCLNFAG